MQLQIFGEKACSCTIYRASQNIISYTIKKFYEYAKAGIPEYWIVDTEKCSIEIYVLRSGEYNLTGKWSVGETAYSKVLTGFKVSVDSVFHCIGDYTF